MSYINSLLSGVFQNDEVCQKEEALKKQIVFNSEKQNKVFSVDTIMTILSNLTFKEIKNAIYVSKDFYRASNKELAWTGAFQSIITLKLTSHSNFSTLPLYRTSVKTFYINLKILNGHLKGIIEGEKEADTKAINNISEIRSKKIQDVAYLWEKQRMHERAAENLDLQLSHRHNFFKTTFINALTQRNFFLVHCIFDMMYQKLLGLGTERETAMFCHDCLSDFTKTIFEAYNHSQDLEILKKDLKVARNLYINFNRIYDLQELFHWIPSLEENINFILGVAIDERKDKVVKVIIALKNEFISEKKVNTVLREKLEWHGGLITELVNEETAKFIVNLDAQNENLKRTIRIMFECAVDKGHEKLQFVLRLNSGVLPEGADVEYSLFKKVVMKKDLEAVKLIVKLANGKITQNVLIEAARDAALLSNNQPTVDYIKSLITSSSCVIS